MDRHSAGHRRRLHDWLSNRWGLNNSTETMTKPKPTDPLTVAEMETASERFFPLFEVVRSRMPEGASVEDTLKVMENIAKLAHKTRAESKEDGKGPFGFNKKET